MPRPFFSVIVPIYNVEEYIGECLDSLQAQSFRDFELIAIDDGSSDNSAAVIERYAAEDGRIRLIRQANAGPSSSRNTGVAAAVGAYCLFVDSDDVVHPQLLEICHHLLSRHGADFISYNCARLDPHEEHPWCHHELDKLRYHLSDHPYHLLAQRHRYRISLITHGTCYRTELAQKHPFIEGIIYEDYPHTVCILQDSRLVISLPYDLYGYTKRPGSLMHCRFTTENIAYYRTGLLAIADAYQNNPRAHAIVGRIIYPEFLKQMGNNIFRSNATESDLTTMLCAMRSFLFELSQRGLFSWRGHKLKRYFAYRTLMRTEEAAVQSLIPRLRRIFS